jgi:hypothetical protein
VYDGVPPDTTAVAVPLDIPQQPFEKLTDVVNTGGSVIVTDSVAVHPFPSVTVTKYVPAERLLIEEVVCTGEVFQL